ncbi:MAG: hypothetical protein ABL997_15140 [Planctomycetota bacterium]
MARAYTGPLCHYFAGANGEPLTYVSGVEDWRRDLQQAFDASLVPTLTWREDATLPGSWHDLADGGLIALRLFAFYAEKSDLDLPDNVPALVELDRDYREALDAKFARSKYGHLLSARLWLPQDFAFTARIALPDGDAIEMGSLPVLKDQLRWLNARTFQADEEQIATWVGLPAELGGPLLAAAQRGYASLSAAVAEATARALPLVVVEA